MPKPTTLKEEPYAGESPQPQPDLLKPDASDAEKIQRLVIALGRVQGAMAAAPKDATNPHFKSKYATLASVWASARKPLAENGFAVVQQTIPGEAGAVMLHTVLYHRDGANIDMLYPVVYGQCTAQALGAALKYARRYSFETIIGVTTDDDPEDDDGNKAPAPPPPRQQAPAQVQRAPNPAPAATIQGARPTLQDQATAYISKVEGTKTWEEFMAVLAEAGDLVERVRVADKSGKWVTRINEIVREKRDTLEVPPEKPAEAPPVPEAKE